eukprot:CAMPEP_0182875480 /NCGR_PEP_ID=MMETSP0034_2-20130328/13567_1 /TAXON_ID=156128 /ORGANISM="Nephroselmis pyriformis, Strain CCMP717" /LENGTH=73 /DNA_ID=CAMNT_0025008219 /DNA_START=22 /DNA_END=241 /DNA_ORIENTATION=+
MTYEQHQQRGAPPRASPVASVATAAATPLVARLSVLSHPLPVEEANRPVLARRDEPVLPPRARYGHRCDRRAP